MSKIASHLPRWQIASRFASMWRASGHADLDDQELKSRAAHLAARLPMLYLIFALTALLVVYAFYGSASMIQTVVAPSIYISICLMRARYWSNSAVLARDEAVLRKDISRLQYVGPGVIVFAITWIVSLYPGASVFQQGVVHYVVGVMITSGMLTLIDTPRTALLGGLAAATPFCAVLLIFGDLDHAMIALCQVAVTALLSFIAVRYYEDLGQMLKSSRKLRERQIRIEENAADLKVLSTTDPLTGILNRRAILALAEENIADQANAEPWLALLDLDGFKQINDTYGHPVGDEVLQLVANRIRTAQGIDHCGRIGGDEFAFLISGEKTQAQTVAIAERLADSIAAPVEINGICITPRASIGLRKTERMSLGECLERADFALFKAKVSDVAVALFDKAQEQELLFKTRVASDFKDADLEEELDIEFQPIIDFDTRQILSLEALARWKRKDSSVVMPGIFIDLAETTGRICEITDCMISKAIAFASEWPNPVGVHINLSPHDLMREELASFISSTLDATAFPASRVTFEVTETTLITKPEEALSAITSIRALGCRVALDDFGTGFSSLAYLDRFPFDQVKLDREFARKFGVGTTSAAIASTVFELCQKLRMDCTVEGIECFEQAVLARNMGMRRMQGYYFAKPLKHDAVCAMLANGEWHEDFPEEAAKRSAG
ncbi:MAG: EAL domain-containing protein [Pseudomonadota bacterium]